jgi:ABC-type nitrate/sulfonate/bicarbonate transport system permease component
VFGAILIIGFLGFVTDLGFRHLRGRMMPWYREARG